MVTPADSASAYPTWPLGHQPGGQRAPASVSTPSAPPAPSAAAREWPLASMIGRDREALGQLVEQHGQEQQHAEGRADHEAGRDGHAVEQRVHAEPEHRQLAGRRPQQGLGMRLLAEVEVRRDRVLEEMDAEVAEQHEQEGVRDVGRLGQHPHEGRGQHEARPRPPRSTAAAPGLACGRS